MHLNNYDDCSEQSSNNIFSDIERVSFLSTFSACFSFTKPLLKPKGSKSKNKQMVDEKVYHVERVLNERQQKDDSEFEIK